MDLLKIKNILAIHAIGHPTMAWYTVTKIFDIECALEARSKETPERRDQRCKAGKDEKM
jgi:hypothetical protein